MTSSPRNWTRAAALLFLVLVPILFHWRVLTEDDRTVPWDFVSFHLPHLVVLQEAWTSGSFPFWDQYNYCGRPFAANPQTQTFYLPRWITAALGRSHLELVSGLEMEMVAHIILGSLFAALLARRLQCEWPASAFAGVAYGGGCFFASQVQHVGVIEWGAWQAGIWWAVAGVVQRPGLKRAALLCLLMLMMLLTGFIPGVPIVYGCALLFAILLAWAWRLPVLRSAGFVLGAILASLLLSSVQLIPAIELAEHSIAKYRLDFRGTGGGVPWEAFVSLVWPDYYGVSDLSKFKLKEQITFSYLFGGFIPLALIFTGSFLAMKDRLVRILLVTLAVAAVCMLGDRTPAGLLLWYAIPAKVRASYYPHYWIMIFSLSFALASAVALQRLRLPEMVKALLVPALAAELIWISAGMSMNSTPYAPGDRITHGYYAGDRTTPALLRSRAGRSIPPRFDVVDESPQWPVHAPLLGIPSANGYDPMTLERLIQARLLIAKGERWGATYLVEQPESPMLEAMNVDRLLVQSGTDLRQPSHWALAQAEPRRVYQRIAPSRRFYFVPDVISASGLQEAATLVRNSDWHPARRAVVENFNRPGTSASADAVAEGQVSLISYRPGEIRLRTESPTGGLLFISEAFHPGWKAAVDGRESDILPTNVAFQGVMVPGGSHEVRAYYSPKVFLLGGAVSLATAVSLAVLLFLKQQG